MNHDRVVQNLVHAFHLDDDAVVRGARELSVQTGAIAATKDLAENSLRRYNEKHKVGARSLNNLIAALRNCDQLRVETAERLVHTLVFCRTHHVCTTRRGTTSNASTPSSFSSPFNRRAASRNRINSVVSPNEPLKRNVRAQSFAVFDASKENLKPHYANNHMFESANSLTDLLLPSTSRADAFCDNPKSLSALPATPLRARIGAPPTISEDVLTVELVAALQGIEGPYFRYEEKGLMCITTACSISEDIAALVDSYLLVVNKYVEYMRVTKSRGPTGSVSRVLLSAVRDILSEYSFDVGGISKDCKRLTVLAPVVEKWREIMSELAVFISWRDESSVDILNALYNYYRATLYSQNSCVERVLEPCVSVFCMQLHEFLLQGINTFENKSLITSDECGDIVIGKVPHFLNSALAHYILKIGKSWRFVNVQKDADRLSALETMVEREITAKALYRCECRDRLCTALLRMCSSLCGSVVNSLLHEQHLIQHVTAAKTFLLVQDVSFAQALYALLTERSVELSRSIDALTANRCLLLAVKRSPVHKHFPFPITIDTHNYTRSDEVALSSARLSCVESLRPFYRASGVVSRFFDKHNSREIYIHLFHFIWSIELARRSLSDMMWNVLQLLRHSSQYPATASFAREFLSIAHRFERVFQMLQQYSTLTVEQNFARFCCTLQSVEDFDDITNEHKRYLDLLCKALFVDFGHDSQRICAQLNILFSLAGDLNKLHISFSQYWAHSRPPSPDCGAADLSTIEFLRLEERSKRDSSVRHEFAPTLRIIDNKLQKTLKVIHDELSNLDRTSLLSLLLDATLE